MIEDSGKVCRVDWDRIEALEESLREHMAEIHRLKALAQPEPTRSQQMRDAGYTRRPRQLPKEDEQEPVAWLSIDCIGERYLCFSKPNDNDEVYPLYTAPPQRKPLTEDEIADAANSCRWSETYHITFARAIERVHGIEDKE